MISIAGIGWIDKKEYGCVNKGLRASYNDQAFPKNNIFAYPLKNFGRLDAVSKMTCSAAALALKDAGMEFALGVKQDTGIISTNTAGCLETDMNYFKDYLECGRTLGRGNLFIYTLPSSPSGEAAIHFGLQGPLLYITGKDHPAATALETASEIILGNESSAMLAGMGDADSAVYFYLKKISDAGENGLCSMARARKILRQRLTLRRKIDEFINLKKGSIV